MFYSKSKFQKRASVFAKEFYEHLFFLTSLERKTMKTQDVRKYCSKLVETKGPYCLTTVRSRRSAGYALITHHSFFI